MGSNPSYFHGGTGREPATGEVQGNRPVENVTWYDAIEFCNKLSEKEGLQPVYTISGRTPATGYPITGATVTADWGKNGYRLPTEAQWEYAAKGGPDSPGSYTYAGSNTIGDVAWYSSNSGDKTHEVGKKDPNGLGLYDMSGTVWEWCWDWYGSYSSDAQTDPAGAVSGTGRVERGGGWDYSAGYVRSAFRDGYNPGGRYYLYPYVRYNLVGFRLVRP
jgi:formylglycine-generating enzyme required for sulfatase activity